MWKPRISIVSVGLRFSYFPRRFRVLRRCLRLFLDERVFRRLPSRKRACSRGDIIPNGFMGVSFGDDGWEAGDVLRVVVIGDGGEGSPFSAEDCGTYVWSKTRGADAIYLIQTKIVQVIHVCMLYTLQRR